MQDSIKGYFSNLKDTFSKIIVTDYGNKEFSLAEGIEKAISLIISQTAKDNKVIFIGNGGSASIASHMAIDFWKNGGMKALSFNDSSQLTCLSNDYGYQYVFEKPIRVFAAPGDVLVAISSSGCSENILRAVSAAKEGRCRVITMSGFNPENPLRYSNGDLNFYIPVQSYGFVEIIHQAICHCVLDLIIEKKAENLVEEAV